MEAIHNVYQQTIVSPKFYNEGLLIEIKEQFEK